MGITVNLEDENGKEIASVGDPTNLLHHALPKAEDIRFQWANTIDWYGDTTFNRIQADLLMKEWSILVQNAMNEKTAELLKRIQDLLKQCVSGVHLYVKFYGD